MDKGCVYEIIVVGRIGWQQWGMSLSLDWPCRRMRGDMVLRRCMPTSTGRRCALVPGKKGEVGSIYEEVK